ncbi:ankyrin repeat-containing domain protein [Xylaria venustula]|nr:ankyrin repeat-containing domain protein [Xylaria venustula]
MAATSCAQHNFLGSFDLETWLRLSGLCLSFVPKADKEMCENPFYLLSSQNSAKCREEMSWYDTTEHGYIEEIEDSFPNGSSSGNRERYDTRSQLELRCSQSVSLHPPAEQDLSNFWGGMALLGRAADNNHIGLVRLLLDRGANTNTLDEYGNTPLFYAAYLSNTEVAQLLLDRGAEVDAKDHYGHTVLFNATRRGKIELVRLLLETGARVDAKDVSGETALQLATREENKKIARLLESYLKDVFVVSGNERVLGALLVKQCIDG